MRILTFLAPSFSWKSFSKTIEPADPGPVDEAAEDAVVAFLHVEQTDVAEDRRKRAIVRTLKHLKWIANKRGWRTVVLHSFTHLGGDSAPPDAARAFLRDLADRLERGGYATRCTPFGWFCSWSLDVAGESLAKVYKEY